MEREKITIIGAGLVGSLLSLLLSKEGFRVAVFEKRPDPRSSQPNQGRSINLALSHRGIRALEKAGAHDYVKEHLIPMKGRMMHDQKGERSFQPYGKTGQHINSVPRIGLNQELISLAESAGTSFHFEQKGIAIEPDETTIYFEDERGTKPIPSDILIGADGAYSLLRRTLQEKGHCSYEEQYIAHGYKELSICAINGDFAMEPNYLHIWPRGNFMLIALPNPDKTFTCTLFFPFEGEPSFASLDSKTKVRDFFERNFPDVIPLMPDLLEQFDTNPTSNLVTIKTYPWNYKSTLLIGDASHAIVPFYGQGMNAGFEDCRLLLEWGKALNFDWKKLLGYFSENRKKDTDAIAELALQNFVEMRDKVADQRFLAIKKVERRLQEEYPDIWIPLYSMVTFTDIPYHQALETGRLQEQIMQELPATFDPDKVDLKSLIDKFQKQNKSH